MKQNPQRFENKAMKKLVQGSQAAATNREIAVLESLKFRKRFKSQRPVFLENIRKAFANFRNKPHNASLDVQQRHEAAVKQQQEAIANSVVEELKINDLLVFLHRNI